MRFRLKFIGLLLILSGVLLNKWALAYILAPDGEIQSKIFIVIISLGQILLLIAGLWLIVSKSGYSWSGKYLWGLSLLCLVMIFAGAYGTIKFSYNTAINRGWIQPEIKDPQELCTWLSKKENPFFGEKLIDTYSKLLKEANKHPDRPGKIVRLKEKLAEQLLRHGRVDEAIEKLESAYKWALSKNNPSIINRLRRALGIAYLRRGEVQHCIQMHNSERCIFPIKNRGKWTKIESAQKAIEYFEAYLKDNPNAVDVRWLLNISFMTVGNYPDGVPEDQLISPEVFASRVASPRFRDIAMDLGVATFNGAGGAIMDDFDNDGFLDIITSSIFPCEPLRYFHNNGDGTFSDWSAKAGLNDQLGGLNIVQADYNNDGLLDILVLRGAWMGPKYGRQRNSLLRQNPDGTFTDVTIEAGLGNMAYPCQAAAWADFDNDGDLDLYIGNENFPSELFLNKGDGTFTDIAKEAGVTNDGMTKGVAWGDYDNDGDPDLYVSNLGQPNKLYRNNGDGTFVNVAKELGVAITDIDTLFSGLTELDEYNPGFRKNLTFVCWFWDINNDGWLDLYVGGYSASLKNVAADYLGEPTRGARLKIYLNDGKGKFVDATVKMGIAHVRLPMGANYGDIDNDGFLDFYLGTGQPRYEYLVPNVLYRNIEGKRFEDVTTAAGVGHLQKGHGIAFGDLDNDGDQDIFEQMGGFFPADAFYDALFENLGNSNHWITIILKGVQTNRFAIGATIKLTLNTPSGTRYIFNTVSSGGSFGGSSLQQEIGLGNATGIKELEIYWPASKTHQIFKNVKMDQFIEITEGAKDFHVIKRKILHFKAT